MKNRVIRDFTIKYSEVDYFKRLTPWNLLNFLEETGFYHSMLAGDGSEAMEKRHETWVVYKWYLQINKYPTWQDKIQVSTWMSEAKGYKAFREFVVRDSEKNIIAVARMVCMLVDTAKGAAKRIPAEMEEAYGIDAANSCTYDFNNFSLNTEADKKTQFPVRMSDIDSNGHVNNAKYLEWFAENIPLETCLHYQMNQIEIIYRQQVKYGKMVSVLSSRTEESTQGIVFTGQIKDENGKTAALLRSSYRPN